jgi:hypothetical protein
LLSYPGRASVSLALEEVKRFLESAVSDSLIEKIIFVVFSSNDEFVYKNLLPIYFPPLYTGSGRAPSASVIRQDTGTSATSVSSQTPRQTLFGSIGEAFRSLRPGKSSDASRPITSLEEHALISFELHAKGCETCGDIDRLYLEGRDLCKDGYGLAQTVLFHMNMQSDMEVYTKPDAKGLNEKLEIPPDMFPISLGLLATVENSYRDENRSRPFVSPNRPYTAIVKDQDPSLTSWDSVEHHHDKGNTSGESEPKKARARVFVRADNVASWNAVTPNECQIRVFTNRINIHENPIYVSDQPPLMLLALDHRTDVQRHRTTPEVILSGTTWQQPSVSHTEGDILFRCRSDNECNALLRTIRRVIEGLQAAHDAEGKQETSGAPKEPRLTTSDEYLKWNQRLHDIQDELASTKRASGGLSDLQLKMERLSAAVSGLNSNAPNQEGALKLYDTSRSPLATRILVCLTADLKSRPGSYVGLRTEIIVSELDITLEEAQQALQELVSEGEVHNTVDDDTWVITHLPDNLPVLSEEQLDANERKTQARQHSESVQSAEAPTKEHDDDQVAESSNRIATNTDPSTKSEQQNDPAATRAVKLSPAAEKVHTYLLNYTFAPPDGAHHILDIAAAVYLTREEVRQALSELKDLGMAHVSGKNGWWWATKVEDNTSAPPDPAQPTIRETPDFKDTPPSPTTAFAESSSSSRLHLDTLNLDDFFSYASPTGARWTRVDTRLIDPRVLVAADEEFEDMGDSLVVHRVLRRGEIRRWAEESLRIREGRGENRIDKGKGRRRDERDEYQERLDRVIAGDMKEEEMRHFGDGEDERFI